MTAYLNLTMLFNTAVDFMLLQGTNCLARRQGNRIRSFLASVMGGIYAGLCLIPSLSFLGSPIFRAAGFAVIAGLAFGWNRDALGLGGLFLLLNMALGGIAFSIGARQPVEMTLACAGVWMICKVSLLLGKNSGQLVTVEVCLRGKTLGLTALQDTGNHLRDPITGESVLVLSAGAAQSLTGLTPLQLRCPLDTLLNPPLPGLRLIPYRCAGGSGMLLSMRMDSVRIGCGKGSRIVAFAPEDFGRNEGFQALTGGLSG